MILLNNLHPQFQYLEGLMLLEAFYLDLLILEIALLKRVQVHK